ncbi:MAG: SURF1 family protein [Geminicoccaceae bacterium]|nr:SURF1 family protein [Geminicoccaceae bacterium]
MSPFRPGTAATVAAIISLCILLALGTWQIRRLHWKEALIADIANGLSLPATDLSEVLHSTYRHVTASGEILAEPRFFLGSATRSSELGTSLEQVFVDSSGRQWLLERGWIPDPAMESGRKGAFDIGGTVQIEAVTRPLKATGVFTPSADYVQGRIYGEDVSDLDRRFGLDLQPMALVLQSVAPASGGANLQPVPVDVDPHLPNNHLGYAITWYGLALALIGVYIAFGWSRGREESE